MTKLKRARQSLKKERSVNVRKREREKEKEAEREREEWGFSLPAKGVLGRSKLHTIRNKYKTA